MKYLLFLINICFSLTLFSQSEKINWIFFIDNKVPNPNMLEGEFVYKNGSLEKSVKFEYTIGDIEVRNEEFRDLESCDSLIIKLKYKKLVGNTLNFYNYTFQVPSRLLFKYDYVVLDIKNINKRKGYFCFDYSSNYEKTVRVKRRGMTTSNTSNGYIYRNEIIMKEIEKEKRRVIIIDV
ncbi:MAG: hypothetical protein J6W06_08330 [Bacteroidales bacterium]|nr:hypothetical protein [Bacteroidales bacterium]